MTTTETTLKLGPSWEDRENERGDKMEIVGTPDDPHWKCYHCQRYAVVELRLGIRNVSKVRVCRVCADRIKASL